MTASHQNTSATATHTASALVSREHGARFSLVRSLGLTAAGVFGHRRAFPARG